MLHVDGMLLHNYVSGLGINESTKLQTLRTMCQCFEHRMISLVINVYRHEKMAANTNLWQVHAPELTLTSVLKFQT